jgi:hypothetical protein
MQKIAMNGEKKWLLQNATFENGWYFGEIARNAMQSENLA